VLAITAPGSDLAAPARLLGRFKGPNTLWIYEGTVLRQVKTPAGLIDIVPISPSQYDIKFYSGTATQTQGHLFVPAGVLFVTWTVQSSNSNTLILTETGAGSSRTFTYTFDPTTGAWSLDDNQALARTITWSSTIGSSVYRYRETRQGSVLVHKSRKKYEPVAGRNVLKELLEGDASITRTTTYTYYSASGNGNNDNQLQQIDYPDGNWEIFQYDPNRRVKKRFTAFGNQGPSTTEALVHVTEYNYESEFPDDADLIAPLDPREVVIRSPGSGASQEISRRYRKITVSGTEEITEIQQRIDPGEGWNHAANLRTISVRHALNGVTEPNRGRLKRITRQDGTMSFHTYAQPSTTWSVTELTGEPNASASGILNGRETVTIRGAQGELISRVTKAIENGAVTKSLDSETYDYAIHGDFLKRSHRRSFLDGTYEDLVHSCCGPASWLDRDGVLTSYIYDNLRRLTGTVRQGITTTLILDPLGRTLVTTRSGSSGNTITLSQTAYDVAGRMVKQTNALAGVTTFSETMVNGSLQRTTVFPDGGQRVETHYRDGRLEKVTGSAAFPLRYDYGVELEGGFQRAWTIETKLDSNNSPTTELEKSYTDGAGFHYKVVYGSGAAAPFRRWYRNKKGQLWKERDPDGIFILRQFDGEGAIQYSVSPGGPASAFYGAGASYDSLDESVFNPALHLAGTDRVTRTQRDFSVNSGFNAYRVRTYALATDNSNAELLLATREDSVDGLRRWETVWNSGQAVVRRRETSRNTTAGSRIETEFEPNGAFVTATYQQGRLISRLQSDSTGAQIGSSTYSYDEHGRVSAVTDARTGSTTYAYNNADQAVSTTSPSPGPGSVPLITSIVYNNMLQAWKVTHPDGASQTNEFHLHGLIKRVTGAREYPVGYGYDSQGRMKSMTNWSALATGSGARVTTWTYDSQGRLANKRYPDNTGPDYTYTAGGRVKSRLWARLGAAGQRVTTSYSYGFEDALAGNDYGDLVSITYANDPLNTSPVIQAYDRRGRLRSATQGSASTVLAYNDTSLPLSESHTGGTLDGVSIDQTYDALLRPWQLTARRNGSAIAGTATFSYDNASRLNTVSDGVYSASYRYLANSPHADQITFQQGSTVTLTTTKTFDNLDRLSSISSLGSFVVSSHAYHYNSASQRDSVTLRDGSYWNYAYDSLGQVISAKRYWVGGAPVAGQQFEYTFDEIGNRTSIRTGGDTSGGSLRNSNYTPNTLNQYTARTQPGALDVIGSAHVSATVSINGASAVRQGEYYWAAVGVNNSSGPVWTAITVSATLSGSTVQRTGNAFVPAATESYQHDADGNLLSDGRWNYSWDAENRLVRMIANTAIGPQQRIDFEYDWRGRRIAKKVWNNVSGSGSPVTLKFIYDGWNLLAELDGNNNLLRSYLWGLDLSGGLHAAGGVGGLLYVKPAGQPAQFCAYDGNGNLALLVDGSTAAVSAEYEYSPFGETLRLTGLAAAANPFRFSTKYTDSDTDLIYYGYRFLNPTTGRWLNRDRYGENGGLNLYGFVYNNPKGFVDSLGLYEIDVHFYLTYWLASKIPCFTGAEATQIANADQGTDENPNTRPGLGLTAKQREQNRKYHALHPLGDGQNYLGELWGDATERPIGGQRSYSPSDPPMQMRRNCDLNALGVYLHHLQDTFSHRGFESDVYGHARRVHGNDKTADDYAKSAQMAAATWNALQNWVKICRCQCYNDKLSGKNLFVWPMGRQLTAFLEASGGPASREINQEEIDRKRGILRVDPR
jgi:RHS repeat-associated protein